MKGARFPWTFVRRLNANENAREAQWHALVRHAKARGRTSVLLGDFNTIDFEPLYGTVTESFIDAAAETISGVGCWCELASARKISMRCGVAGMPASRHFSTKC